MGSRSPPPGKPPHADLQEPDAVGHPLSSDHATKITALQRIADALQVPPAALYQPPNAVQAAPRPVEQTEGECATLIHAFLQIRDPEERRRILAIVQASAERV